MNHFLPTIVTLPADAEPACAGLWSLFDSTEPDDHAAAKRLCSGCPVRSTCSEIALSQRDSPTGRLAIEGTWAGELHGAERSRIRSSRAKTAPTADDRCGGETGYDAHRRRHEYPCAPCREAARVALAERRSKRAGEAA